MKDFLKGARDGLPIGLGYVSVAFAFGMMAVGEGLSVWQAVLLSMANVTSAGQLAGLSLMASGAPLFEMALTQLIINMRYALMSISLSQRLDESMTTLHRALIAFCNTDEVFAVASSQPGSLGRRYLYGLTITPYIGWSLGTLLGAAAGAILPLVVREALGIAIYGMFLAIILPPAKKDRAVRAAVVLAVALSCAMRYLPVLNRISGGFRLILCAVGVSALCARLFPIREVDV